MITSRHAYEALTNTINHNLAQNLERLGERCEQRAGLRRFAAMLYHAAIVCRSVTPLNPERFKPDELPYEQMRKFAQISYACGFVEAICESAKVVHATQADLGATNWEDEDIADITNHLSLCATELHMACRNLSSQPFVEHAELIGHEIDACMRKIQWVQRDLDALLAPAHEAQEQDRPT